MARPDRPTSKRARKSAKAREKLVTAVSGVVEDVRVRSANVHPPSEEPPSGLASQLTSNLSRSSALAYHAWFRSTTATFDPYAFAASLAMFGVPTRVLYHVRLSEFALLDAAEVLLPNGGVVTVGASPSECLYFVLGAVFGATLGEANLADVTMRYAFKEWSTCLARRGVSLSGFLNSTLLVEPCGVDWTAELNEMRAKCERETMPKSIAGFKRHASLILESDFSKNDRRLLQVGSKPVGTFKGENVFLRENVKQLRTELGWRTLGRTVVFGEDPRRVVKRRALFEEAQTKKTPVLEVSNKKIPKNAYGNVELFLPDLLPVGAVHVPEPCPFMEEACVELNVDFASAVVGFRAAAGKYVAKFDGFVVVSSEAPRVVSLAKQMKDERLKEMRSQRSDEVLRWWAVLAKKLRLRKTLSQRYGEDLCDVGEGGDVGENRTMERSVAPAAARASDVCVHAWVDGACSSCGMEAPFVEEL